MDETPTRLGGMALQNGVLARADVLGCAARDAGALFTSRRVASLTAPAAAPRADPA
jgi:hypothetical protein